VLATFDCSKFAVFVILNGRAQRVSCKCNYLVLYWNQGIVQGKSRWIQDPQWRLSLAPVTP